METLDYRNDCTLDLEGWEATGLAHVIEIRYSDRIQFCNFVMQITTDQLGTGGNRAISPSTPATLTLEDGREAAVHITHFNLKDNYFEMAGTGNF